jgi:Ca2+-binding RTX toxin-like protein
LIGGEGVDHLNGKGGDDTFIVNILPNGLLEDTVTNSNGTNDTIKVVIGSLGNYSGTGTNLSLPFTIENIDISGTGSAILNLKGSATNNILTGNSANNLLDGKTGLDTLIGGLGDDTYIIKNSTSKIIELAGQGYDTVNSDVNFDLSTSGNNVEKLTLKGLRTTNATGNSLDNLLTGNIFKNTLNGKEGHDTLYGMGGNDSLEGGAGNDLLIGGTGNDILTGGLGTDTFWFNASPNNVLNKDTITDFTSSNDKLQFSASVFNKLSVSGHFTAGDTRFWSNTNGVAHDTTDRLIYSLTTGKLFYDADGSGANSSVLIALLTNHPVLVATDIWVF